MATLDEMAARSRLLRKRNESPVKVAFVSSCVRGAGSGWSLYYLLKYLDRQLIEPLVVTPTGGIFDKRFADLGLAVVTLERFPETPLAQLRFTRDNRVTRAASVGLNVLDTVRLLPRLVRLFRDRGTDLVYCNHEAVSCVGAVAAQLAGVPCVVHARSLDDPTSPWNRLYRTVGWPLTRGAAFLPAVRRVIANSAATAVPYNGRLAPKVRIVHNGVDLNTFDEARVPRGTLRAELNLDPGATIVGFTSQIKPRKGIDVLMRAATGLLAKQANVVFVVLGEIAPEGRPHDRADYQTLARELGIADRFIFAGFRHDVQPALADFDILCVPSHQEAFGRPIVEAMAFGRPVVATHVGGIPEIITDGVDGVLVPPGDSDALADALGRLVDDPALRARMGKAARECVRTRFDVAMLTRRIEDILLDVAAEDRHPHAAAHVEHAQAIAAAQYDRADPQRAAG